MSINTEALVQGLFAVRAMVDSLLAQIAPATPEFEAVGGTDAGDGSDSPRAPKCPHKTVEDTAGFGTEEPRWACLDCGEEVQRAQ